MTLEGNTIICDGYGCQSQDSFMGDLPPDDILVRYSILGWQFAEIGGQEAHFCPDHH